MLVLLACCSVEGRGLETRERERKEWGGARTSISGLAQGDESVTGGRIQQQYRCVCLMEALADAWWERSLLANWKQMKFYQLYLNVCIEQRQRTRAGGHWVTARKRTGWLWGAGDESRGNGRNTGAGIEVGIQGGPLETQAQWSPVSQRASSISLLSPLY